MVLGNHCLLPWKIYTWIAKCCILQWRRNVEAVQIQTFTNLFNNSLQGTVFFKKRSPLCSRLHFFYKMLFLRIVFEATTHQVLYLATKVRGTIETRPKHGIRENNEPRTGPVRAKTLTKAFGEKSLSLATSTQVRRHGPEDSLDMQFLCKKMYTMRAC